jgi:imidazolonepropionase-like amidohydrolase
MVTVSMTLCLFSSQEKTRAADSIALIGGTLIDGTGASPVENTTVLVEGKKIRAVGPMATVKIPEGARRINVAGKWILPGFIDAHIHLTYPADDRQHFTQTDSLATLRALHFMNIFVRCGITSVRDVGSPVEPMRALNEAAQLGYVDTIRLFSCGQLLTVTGGHGDDSKLSRAVDGPWEWRKAVREMRKAGFDHIKISPTFTIEEVKAAVDEAKTLGMRITSHGGGLSDTTPTTMTRIAVQAGVDCIEHLNEMKDDVLDLIAEKRVYLVPTLAIYREQYKANDMNRILIDKRGWTVALHETLFKKAMARKITMGIGTDAVGKFMTLYPRLYFMEMKYFVELGASPMDAIVAATRNGALILGKEDVLGTIKEGKLADIQVVNGNPLKSLDALGQPEIVVIGGTVHAVK